MDVNKQIIDAATGLAQANNSEIYKDALQPTVRELGKNLHTLSKLITVALSPISGLVWGFDKISEYIQKELPKKFEKVPEEDIVTPDPAVAGPALEAMRFLGQKDELKEMFIGLIASSMNKKTAQDVHPAFVEVIKQLTPLEAVLLKNLASTKENIFAIIKTRLESSYTDHRGLDWIQHVIEPRFGMNITNQRNYTVALDNLNRLKIVDIEYEKFLEDSDYATIESGDIVAYCKQHGPTLRKGYPLHYSKKGVLTITDFGKNFINSCVN